MEYTLAKKLKEAGWQADLDRNQTVDVDGYMWASPTLSQLIEACGAGKDDVRNFKLERVWVEADGGGGFMWQAFLQWEIDGEYHDPSIGHTPEEAVAWLWLSLQASAPK